MPRTIDSIVESHRLSRERRAQGKPSWARSLALKPLSDAMRARLAAGEPGETVAAETCQAIANLLKASLPAAWFDITDPDYDRTLDDLWEALDGTTAEEFASGDVGTAKQHLAAHLDGLYDWADRARIWLGR